MAVQMMPKHCIEFVAAGVEGSRGGPASSLARAIGGGAAHRDASKRVGATARRHEAVTLLFMDVVSFTTMSKVRGVRACVFVCGDGGGEE